MAICERHFAIFFQKDDALQGGWGDSPTKTEAWGHWGQDTQLARKTMTQPSISPRKRLTVH